ncbi:hypothetical protein H2248_006773 [Termitomyces sp. 'cryptogamus']|nr:hypothetical protein H2248_006773 [Termitomyces sp. 'cryptogamus']
MIRKKLLFDSLPNLVRRLWLVQHYISPAPKALTIYRLVRGTSYIGTQNHQLFLTAKPRKRFVIAINRRKWCPREALTAKPVVSSLDTDLSEIFDVRPRWLDYSTADQKTGAVAVKVEQWQAELTTVKSTGKVTMTPQALRSLSCGSQCSSRSGELASEDSTRMMLYYFSHRQKMLHRFSHRISETSVDAIQSRFHLRTTDAEMPDTDYRA